ncbi:MAG: hypothetical protein COA43_11875 [Robiginitomaculum sp.]|nr:MAG: hypothetical protein COA43_11875 [Robiginitomaculum sp.]
MLLSGFPDLLSFNRQTRQNSDIKARLEITSQEAVTGFRADPTAAMNGDIGGALLLQKALDDIEQDKRINTITSSRLGLMGSILTSARSAISDVGTQGLIAVATGNSFALDAAADTAEANLRNVFSLFNSAQGSRKLFAGEATDTLPLTSVDTLLTDIRAIISGSPTPASVESALETYFNDPSGGFATNIYQGGDKNAAPSILADGSRIEFTIRADNQAIKDTLRGLALLTLTRESGHDITSPEYEALYSQGTTLVEKGKSNMIKLESEIGISESLIEKIDTHQRSEKLVLSTAITGLIGRDQYEAATELQLLEAQLEASYLITSRLSNLSLLNFIR